MSSSRIEVISWGIAGSVRDAGRPGLMSLGAARGGAVDVASLALANRLVGNAEATAAIESSGGLHLRVAGSAVMVAIAGGVASIDVAGGVPVGWGAPTVLSPGATLRIGRLLEGVRVYLAIRGGVNDHDGTLTIGADPGVPPATEAAPRRGAPDRFRLWPGPRLDWFAPEAWQVLMSSTFTVSAAADRVGMRLTGAALPRMELGELASEGMVEGAMQVPPDGDPIVMLADHPVTGGYPVIAVVDPRDLGQLAQLPPGSSVRFTAHR
ncbi:MAG: allophanate hydrolase [Ilumatobacteraceae bacterium]|nr:allophanate hydrolase [Ilumatobacteraceae bacterium]